MYFWFVPISQMVFLLTIIESEDDFYLIPSKVNLYFKNMLCDVLGVWGVFLGGRIEVNIPKAQVDG